MMNRLLSLENTGKNICIKPHSFYYYFQNVSINPKSFVTGRDRQDFRIGDNIVADTQTFNLLNKKYRYPILIGLTSIVIIIINIIGLVNGTTVVLPHLFYIPIILAAYQYHKTGVYYAAMLGVIYLSSVLLLFGADTAEIISAVGRVVVFVAIAVIIAFLSAKLTFEEQKYRNIVQDQTELISRYLPDKTLRFVNNAYARYFGTDPGNLIGTSFNLTVHPDDHQMHEEHLASLTMQNPTASLKYRAVLPDGEIRWHHAFDRAIFDEENQLVEYQSVQHDITPLVAADEAIQESERQKSEIIDFLPDPTFVIDTKGHVLVWNNAIEQMTGIAAAEILQKNNYEYAIPFYGERRPVFLDFILKNDQKSAEQYYSIIAWKRNLYIAETRVTSLLGKTAILWLKASLLYDQQGRLLGGIETIRDITEIKETSEKLEELLQFQEKIIDNSDIWVVVSDIRGNVRIWNRAAEIITGYSRDEVLGNNRIWRLLTPDKDVQKKISGLIRAITEKPGVITELPFPVLRKDGDKRYLMLSLRSLTGADGTPYATVGMGIDFTDRKNAEDDLLITQFSVDRAGNPIFWVNSDGQFIYVNEKACSELGYSREEFFGMRVSDLDLKAPQEERREFWGRLKHEQSLSFESFLKKKDGTIIPAEIIANYLKFRDLEIEVTTTRDLSEKVASDRVKQSALRQIEENLNQMAYLNDSIRNPLTIIITLAELIGGKDADIIIGQVKEIDKIVTCLDRGWLESEKIREFLLKHYNIGYPQERKS